MLINKYRLPLSTCVLSIYTLALFFGVGDEDGMDQEEAMTSFCAEEQDMDDIGAAGLLSEIENALGMGFGTLGTTVHFYLFI